MLYLPPLYPYQARLLNDPARDACTVSATQVGKTYGLAAWILAMALTRGRSVHPWWWLAPTYPQIAQGFKLVLAFASSCGAVAAQTVTPFPKIQLVTGTEIEFRSWEREQNLAGTSIGGGVVDEAGLLTNEAQGIISTRRSATLGPLRYIGNPGVVAGPFRRLCGLGEDPAWAGTFSLHRWTWRDKRDALEATDPLKAEAYGRFIEQERESIPEFEFRRLYEAEWTEDEAAVFRALPEPDGEPLAGPRSGERYVIGVDVAQQTDYLVAAVLGIHGRRLDAMDRWRGIPYPQSADRLSALSTKWDAPLVIETNGPGLPLYQELVQRGVPCSPFTTTAPTKQEIVVKLASELEHGRLKLANLPPLQHELKSYRYQRMPSGHYRYEAPPGEHDDCVMALAFALHGASRVPDLSLAGWL